MLRVLAAALFLGLFLPPVASVNPTKLPAHDSHQGILVACDPDQSPKRAEKAFGRENPVKVGILPVDTYVRNSTRWPVSIQLKSIRLELVPPGAAREQIAAMSPGEVARRILHLKPSGTESPRPRLPIRFPGIGLGANWQKLTDKLQSRSFTSSTIAPGATVHGFFYFDLGGDFDALRYARFYVPALKFVDHHQAIMFFEADLSRSVQH